MHVSLQVWHGYLQLLADDACVLQFRLRIAKPSLFRETFSNNWNQYCSFSVVKIQAVLSDQYATNQSHKEFAGLMSLWRYLIPNIVALKLTPVMGEGKEGALFCTE